MDRRVFRFLFLCLSAAALAASSPRACAGTLSPDPGGPLPASPVVSLEGPVPGTWLWRVLHPGSPCAADGDDMPWPTPAGRGPWSRGASGNGSAGGTTPDRLADPPDGPGP